MAPAGGAGEATPANGGSGATAPARGGGGGRPRAGCARVFVLGRVNTWWDCVGWLPGWIDE